MSMFKAQNGATVAVRFGSRPSDSELELTFANITDEQARLIIENYELVNGTWNYVEFVTDTKSMESGVEDYRMKTRLRGSDRNTAVKYRYAQPPQVDFVVRNLCTVTCVFKGYLDGGLD